MADSSPPNDDYRKDWEPNYPLLIQVASQNPEHQTVLMAVTQLRTTRIFDKRSKEIGVLIEKHSSNIEELTTSIDSFNQATTALYAETKKSIDEISTKLGSFIDTIKDESAANGKLTRGLLTENKLLGRWTSLLATSTFLLAALTGWMAWSTMKLAEQGQVNYEKEVLQLKDERGLLEEERNKFLKDKNNWENKQKNYRPSLNALGVSKKLSSSHKI